jgi:hypothetical protein
MDDIIKTYGTINRINRSEILISKEAIGVI